MSKDLPSDLKMNYSGRDTFSTLTYPSANLGWTVRQIHKSGHKRERLKGVESGDHTVYFFQSLF